MAKTIFQQQYKEQQKQTALSAAQLVTQRQTLAAQAETNRHLATQSKLMLDEAAKKEYQKQIKNLVFELRTHAENIKSFPTDGLRYVAARLLKFKIDNSSLTTSSFDEIADKTYFGELTKTVTDTVNSVSNEVKQAGDAYLNELANRIGAITQLQKRRGVLQNSFILDLIPLSLIFTFGSKTKALWTVLASQYNVNEAANYASILKISDDIENKIVGELNQYRSETYPEISSLDYEGPIFEPALKTNVALPGKAAQVALPGETAPVPKSETNAVGAGIPAFLESVKTRPAYAVPVGIFFVGSLMCLLSPLGIGWMAGGFMIQVVAGTWATVYKLMNRNMVVWWPIPALGFVLFIVGAILSPKDEKSAVDPKQAAPSTQIQKPQ